MRRVLIIVLFVLISLIVFSYIFSSQAGGILVSVAEPLWGLRLRASEWADVRLTSFSEAEHLKLENNRLREELALATLRLSDRNALSEENISLKSLLGRTEKQTVVAGILTRPSATPYDTFFVDAGKVNGVEVGDLVLAGENIVIGFVENVFSATARIKLFSSSGIETEVLLSSESIPVTAIGTGGGNFTVRVPESIGVAVGDTLVFPGIETRVLGAVGAVQTEVGDTNKTLLIRIPTNTTTLRFVLIESK